MSQEFYLKTQALHEEFQKRELHYLNTEMKLRSNIMSKNKLNLPFEEYLQKINQKEKESEEAYRNVMKQMEELDRHTDVMSSKLEKLGILRNSLTSFVLPNWPSNIRSNLQMYDTTQGFNSNSNDRRYESLEHKAQSISETNLKSSSTQTDNAIYCVKCHSSILDQPKHFTESEYPSFLNIHSRINSEPQATYSTISHINAGTVNEPVSNSQFISSENKEHFTVQSNANKSFGIHSENSETEQHIIDKSSRENVQPDVILSKRHSLAENELGSNKNLNENIQNGSMIHGMKTTKSQHSENENLELKSLDVEDYVKDTSINVEDTFINVEDTFTSKSDAESMNNEFDFLESDKRAASLKMKAQDISKSNKSPSSDDEVNLDKEPSLVVEHPNKPPLKHKDRDAFRPKLDIGDNKSETSESVSAPHSPNISLGSDSDSIYGKGASPTASAAYQALLGNTTIAPKNTKSDNSDSESGDEVENALANVVQRNNLKSKSSKSIQMAETRKEKSSSQTVESKPAVKGSKPPSLNKPQAKLSKNTRKVLGLDTSSGSEVELAVKPPEKKIDEDSDEFDFYD